MSELQRAIRALADEWSSNIGQGSGHYLNPRVVVDRLNAALESEAAPAPSSYDELIEAGWITPKMCAERIAEARRQTLDDAEQAILALIAAHHHLSWEPPESCDLGPALEAVAALRGDA